VYEKEVEMRLAIMGSGGQGAPCASILARDTEVTAIKLCDINGDMLDKVSKKIASPKLSTQVVDARDRKEIVGALDGYDAVIDLVTPAFFENILQAALEAGVHYVNTAWEEYLYEDFDTRDVQVDSTLRYFGEFKAKGKTALLGCGMTSGFASNVLAAYYVEKLDTVESIKFRLAKKNTKVPEAEEILTPWNPGWNPRQALLDFVVPTYKFEDGNFVKMEQVFAEPEIWEFPEPIGRQLVSHHAHEEPFCIPQSFAGKGLKYCDFKYYVNKSIAPIVTLGLGSDEEREIKGQKVRPLDVVLSFVPEPGDSFLNEDPSTFEEQDRSYLVSIMLEIIGTEGGKNVKYTIHVPTMNAPRQVMYDIYGTSYISVALPAAIGAKLLVKGAPRGVINPQDLDAKEFIQMLRDSGYPNEWEERKDYF
jgi:saccharopine dehydrogenase-like NADP-dependent oxidoreductase